MLTAKQILNHMGPFSHVVHNMLSLKAPINTTEDNKFCDIILSFLMENILADDSHEISCLI